MESIINTFIAGFNASRHFATILKEQIISVGFETEDSTYFLNLSQEYASASDQDLQEDSTVEKVLIKGKQQCIIEILKGNLKLRDALASQSVEMATSFRTTLLLETIFFLVPKGYPSELLGENDKILLT